MRISDWSSDVCSSDLFAYGPKNSKQLLLFNHDPAEPGPPPALLGYYPPQGYRVTDAVWLGDDRLMTLNRRVTIYDGFTAKLAMVDISGLKPGKLVHAEELATLRRDRKSTRLNSSHSCETRMPSYA